MLDARTFIHSFIHTLYLSTPKTSVTIIDNWNNITDLHVFRVGVLGRGGGGGGITQLITFLNVIKDLVTLSLRERLFHKWAPLQQILRWRNSVRSLSRANLFALSLRSYSLVNGLNRSCKYSGVRLIKTLKISLAFCFSFWYRGYPILNLCGGR